jgi:hypothetical protein
VVITILSRPVSILWNCGPLIVLRMDLDVENRHVYQDLRYRPELGQLYERVQKAIQVLAFTLKSVGGREPTYSSHQTERLSGPLFASPSTDYDATDSAECG